MRFFIRICRIVAGTIFIFSGLVKGVDPLGSMYKFIDYFTAFGLDSFNQVALILGILLSLTEFVIGFAIISGLRFREGAVGMLLLMGIFTPLTLILAFYNPVSDCGCFGDAIQLTNWQTFAKNIVLLGFVIPLFPGRKRIQTKLSSINEWFVIAGVSIIFILFSMYNQRHLPLIDFRPYAIGTNIQEGMTIPDDAPVDQYYTTLIYEKEGIQKEFTLENYPSGDSSWVFVDQKSVLVKKGYKAPIHDFILTSPEGYDMTDFVLGNRGISLLLIARQLSESDQEQLEQGLKAADICSTNGIDFYLLTASSGDELLFTGNRINYLYGDDTMLKTMIRSNPGYVVIKGATITAKWAGRDLPPEEELINAIMESSENSGYNINIRLFLLLAAAIFMSFVTGLIVEKNPNTVN